MSQWSCFFPLRLDMSDMCPGWFELIQHVVIRFQGLPRGLAPALLFRLGITRISLNLLSTRQKNIGQASLIDGAAPKIPPTGIASLVSSTCDPLKGLENCNYETWVFKKNILTYCFPTSAESGMICSGSQLQSTGICSVIYFKLFH